MALVDLLRGRGSSAWGARSPGLSGRWCFSRDCEGREGVDDASKWGRVLWQGASLTTLGKWQRGRWGWRGVRDSEED